MNNSMLRAHLRFLDMSCDGTGARFPGCFRALLSEVSELRGPTDLCWAVVNAGLALSADASRQHSRTSHPAHETCSPIVLTEKWANPVGHWPSQVVRALAETSF